MPKSSRRATPLTPDQRRASIVDAATAVVVANGRGVTTRQIAEAAGVAEGTLFRVFPDKESIIEAVFTAYLDPERVTADISALDRTGTLSQLISQIVQILAKRFGDIMQLSHAVKHPAKLHKRAPIGLNDLIAEVLSPHAAELRCTPVEAAQWIRNVTLAASILSRAPAVEPKLGFSVDQQVDFLLRGIESRGEPLPDQSLPI